jgi:hypothetical protein
MRPIAFPFVLIAILVLLASMTFVACKAPAAFELSNLTVSKTTVDVGDEVTISVQVENIGGSKGDCTVNFTVDGYAETVTVEGVRAGKQKDASIEFTPTEVKTYTVNAEGLTASFTAKPTSTGECIVGDPSADSDDWWEFEYEVVDGKIELIVGLLGATDEKEGDIEGGEITIQFSKTEEDGAREVRIDKDDWNIDPVLVEDVQVGIDMDLDLTITDDCEGWLYMEGDAGDADFDSVTTPSDSEVDFSGGTDPGGMVIDVPLKGIAETTVGVNVPMDMPVTMTTGSCSDTASFAGAAIDGSKLEATGEAFCTCGGVVADYVGTNGVLVTAGSALKLKLVGMDIDFQFAIEMELEPK